MRGTARRSLVTVSVAALSLTAAAVGQASNPAEPELAEIRLSTGDVLFAHLITAGSEVVLVDHPLLGRLALPREFIANEADFGPGAFVLLFGKDGRLVAEPEPPAEEAPPVASAESAPAEQQPPPPPAPKPNPWKRSIELAASAASGTVETQDVRFGFRADHADPKGRTQFDGAYFYGQREGERSANRFNAKAMKEWLLPESRWFFYGQLRYDFDEFQSWDYRTGGNGGFGFEILKADDAEVRLRGGGGVVREFGSENDTVRPEAVLGADWIWRITDRQQLKTTNELFLDLDEEGEYRNLLDARWTCSLDETGSLKLNIGLQTEYESEVSPGVDHTDLKLFGGVSLAF